MAETGHAAESGGKMVKAKGGFMQSVVTAIVIIVAIAVLAWGLSYLASNPNINIDTLLTGSKATQLP